MNPNRCKKKESKFAKEPDVATGNLTSASGLQCCEIINSHKNATKVEVTFQSRIGGNDVAAMKSNIAILVKEQSAELFVRQQPLPAGVLSVMLGAQPEHTCEASVLAQSSRCNGNADLGNKQTP